MLIIIWKNIGKYKPKQTLFQFLLILPKLLQHIKSPGDTNPHQNYLSNSSYFLSLLF